MSPFQDLKPGDKIVYYQEWGADQYPHPGVSTIRSNDGEHIVLNDISGWTFRVSDGNPVKFDENPRLNTYIVPTTPALIDRVTKQRANVQKYREIREALSKVDWRHQSPHVLDQVYDLVKARPYLCYA